MSGATSVGGYSFYLNVVVLTTTAEHDSSESKPEVEEKSPSDNNAPDPTPAPPPAPAPAPAPAEEEEHPQQAKEASEQEEEAAPTEEPQPPLANEGPTNGETAVAVSHKQTADVHSKMKLIMEGKSLVDFAFGRRTPKPKSGGESSGGSKGSNLVKDGRGFMSSIGNTISKSSSNISKRASRYMANKTMVSRAEKAVVECIPYVTEEIGVEMSISKRFQQGPVFVLEVDMKGCEMLELLEKVLGEEAAMHYTNVKRGLELLGLPEAKDVFLKEILPKLRKAMMDRMSEIVPEKMKQKKAYADLEIQCVALEDAEEAKWLYNFLAFMEEMK